jgi:hypothetical protein
MPVASSEIATNVWPMPFALALGGMMRHEAPDSPWARRGRAAASTRSRAAKPIIRAEKRIVNPPFFLLY